MAEQFPESAAESVARPRWSGPGAWLALLALALLVYELTAQPAVSAVIGCTKFGWEDFRTGRWLRSIDPDRRRGKTCFWFYIAAGVWKVTLTATIVMFVIAVVEALRQPNPQANQPIRPEFLWTLLEAFVGFLLGCLITFVACCAALVRRVKVWVDSRIHRARRRNEWPPMDWQTNRAGRLVVAALFFPVTVLILG
jgi:fumarate reductase subunit D